MTRPAVLSALESAAYAARVSQVSVVSHYNTTFVHDTVSYLRGIYQCNFIESDSFGSAVSAACGASLGGARSMVISSSPKSTDEVATASYSRLPIVIANVSRPLGAFSIRQDHSDVLSLRDSGCLTFMPENNTELVESVVQAYKACEDQKVMLPAVVNIDMPQLAEPVLLPNELFTKRYLQAPRLLHKFDPKKPSYLNSPEEAYAEFRRHQDKALRNALAIIESLSLEWKKKFKSPLPIAETYKTEDADHVIVMAGYHSPTAKEAVDNLRKQGKKVGLLRLRVIRPWPAEHVRNALKGAKKVAVYDQATSLGASGILYGEIKPLTNFCVSFVAIGRHPTEKNFADMFDRLEKSEKEETVWL